MPRVFILLLITTVFISYQNFTSVNSEEWDSTNTLKIIQEMNQFESKEKPLPGALATPQGGSDLKSVSNDWMQRQGSLILNGYDKKLEAAMNEKLNSWVDSLRDPSEPEDSPAATANSANQSYISGDSGSSKGPAKRRQNLRFARVNSLKYEFGDACLDMTADPGNTRFNYSQSLFVRTRLGVEHKTADNQTQMFLKYEW